MIHHQPCQRNHSLCYGSPEGTSNFIFYCYPKPRENTSKKNFICFFFQNQEKILSKNLFIYFFLNQVKMVIFVPPSRKKKIVFVFKNDVVVISLSIKILVSTNSIIRYTHGWFRYVWFNNNFLTQIAPYFSLTNGSARKSKY